MSTIPITAIVLTLNEEAGIAHTLAHLSRFAKIAVVDSHSTDSTVAICERAGAQVLQFTWNGSYPKKKQWALDNVETNSDWVLLLDADEYPSEELLDELEHIFATGETQGAGAFDIKLRYRFAGKFLRHGHEVVKRSLIKRSVTRFPEVDDLDAPGIREVEGHYQPQTTDRVGLLRHPLLHDDRDPVQSWFSRHNRYSDWEAHLRLDAVARREIATKRTRRGQVFDALPLKPGLFFFYGYLGRLGFLDGRAGFDYHIALSMYYWQIGVKERELRRSAEKPPPQRTTRLVQVANTLARSDGGPARNAFELHRSLNSRADTTALLITIHKSPAEDTVAGSRRDLVRGGTAPQDINLLRTLKIIAQSDAVVIHGYYLWWTPLVAPVARLLQKKVLLTPHGSLTAYQQQSSTRKKALFDIIAGRALRGSVDTFVVGSEREAAELREKLPSAETVVAGVGVRRNLAQTEPEFSLSQHNSAVPAGSTVQLLTLSRVAPKKRIDLCIDTLVELRRRGHDARLIVAGSGDERLTDELKAHAARSGFADQITFTGEVSGEVKRELWATSDLFLAPSDDENFGIAVAEALSSGLAAIVSENVESAAAIAAPAGVVTAQEATSLADAAERLLEFSRSERSSASFAFAAANFDWSAVAERWLSAARDRRPAASRG